MPIIDDSDYSAAASDLQLARMSHAELYLARSKAGANQDKLAPYEHRAFAREFAQESPVKAAVSLPFAIPAYTAAKALGIQKARSGASVEEMKQGFIGMLEGLFRKQEAPPARLGNVDSRMPTVRTQRRLTHKGGGVRG